MDSRTLLVLFITLVVASVFLYVWKRRDEGRDPAPSAGAIENVDSAPHM